MANNSIQAVPPVPLVPRDATGLAGSLFLLLDEVMVGKAVNQAKIGAVCKIANAYSGLVRTHIAQEKYRATGAPGLVIDHEKVAGEPAPNGSAGDGASSE
jgi:hypothetical protein